MHLLSVTEIKIQKIPLKSNGKYYLDFHIPNDGLVVLPEIVEVKAEKAVFTV